MQETITEDYWLSVNQPSKKKKKTCTKPVCVHEYIGYNHALAVENAIAPLAFQEMNKDWRKIQAMVHADYPTS